MRKSCLFIAVALIAGVAMADDKPLDVTITVVESPADLPDAVTKTIELPSTASDRARESAQHGLDTANQARALGRQFGQSIADEAKTKGKGRP
jgi:hypothetical protein